MSKISRKTWIIGGVIAALVGTSAFAAKQYSSPEKRIEHVSAKVSNHLNLTDDQKQNFSKVASSFLEVRGGSTEFLLSLSGQLKDLAADKTLTVGEVNTLRDQIKAEFDRRSEVVVPEFVAFYNSLDDTQKTQLLDRMEKMESHIEDRGTRRGWKNRH